MVGVFRRSLSFPNKNPNRPSKPPISHHIRSVSLPCRSHPLISQLKDGISQLHSWASQPHDNSTTCRTSTWLCGGLSRLKDLHDCLYDILQLPLAQESLRRQSHLVEKVLEDFLSFVDVFGIFQTSILALKEEQSAAQIAIRKRDESKIALYVKARKKMAKEMVKLVLALRCISRPGSAVVCVGDGELADVIGDVIGATVTLSLALFNGIAVSLLGPRKSSWSIGLMLKRKAKKVAANEGIQELQQCGTQCLQSLRKKSGDEVRMTLKRMQEMELCIGGIENGSEKIFRSLINSRVSLLNTLTQ